MSEESIAKQLSELEQGVAAHHRACVQEFNSFKTSILDCKRKLNSLKRQRQQTQAEIAQSDNLTGNPTKRDDVADASKKQKHDEESVQPDDDVVDASKKQKNDEESVQQDEDTNPIKETVITRALPDHVYKHLPGDVYKHEQHMQFQHARLQQTKTDWPIFPYETGKMFKCFCGWKPLAWSRLATRQCLTKASWLSIPRVQFLMQVHDVDAEEVMDAKICMKCSIECIACKGVFLLRDSLKYGLCIRCNCK